MEVGLDPSKGCSANGKKKGKKKKTVMRTQTASINRIFGQVNEHYGGQAVA